MLENINSKQLFTSTSVGLQRVYQLLQTDAQGVSKTDLTSYSKLTSSDLSFVQLLSQDFDKIDTDANGKVSSEEMTKLLQTMQTKGLTYEQLVAMSAQTGVTGTNKTLLDTVLTHFSEIDKNKDGKISSAEINAYQVDKEIGKKELDLSKFRASDMSVFYTDETSATAPDSSLLDYKYQDVSTTSTTTNTTT